MIASWPDKKINSLIGEHYMDMFPSLHSPLSTSPVCESYHVDTSLSNHSPSKDMEDPMEEKHSNTLIPTPTKATPTSSTMAPMLFLPPPFLSFPN